MTVLCFLACLSSVEWRDSFPFLPTQALRIGLSSAARTELILYLGSESLLSLFRTCTQCNTPAPYAFTHDQLISRLPLAAAQPTVCPAIAGAHSPITHRLAVPAACTRPPVPPSRACSTRPTPRAPKQLRTKRRHTPKLANSKHELIYNTCVSDERAYWGGPSRAWAPGDTAWAVATSSRARAISACA